jgi:hypothetical protein
MIRDFSLYICEASTMHLTILIVGLSMNSLAAQAFVFFAAGFETSSTTMTFCLYELSLHQDIQERVREEIDVVLRKHGGKITYDAIQEMEYLDKVVSGEGQCRKFKHSESKACIHQCSHDDQNCNHFDPIEYIYSSN